MSVSLRADEVEGIKGYIEEHPDFKTRHEVIKYALRRLLFPDQKKDIPVNGKVNVQPENIVTIDGKPILKSEPNAIYIDGKPILKNESRTAGKSIFDQVMQSMRERVLD